MKEIVWDSEALADFEQAIDFSSQDYASFGETLSLRLYEAIDRLAKNNIGRKGRVVNTFEKSVTNTPYIICYRLEGKRLYILRIIHTSRNWQAGQFPEN